MSENTTPVAAVGSPMRTMVAMRVHSIAPNATRPRCLSISTPTTHSEPRTPMVASAAPRTPSCGNGPHPVIRIGSSTAAMIVAQTSMMNGSRVFPAARNAASTTK